MFTYLKKKNAFQTLPSSIVNILECSQAIWNLLVSCTNFMFSLCAVLFVRMGYLALFFQ